MCLYGDSATVESMTVDFIVRVLDDLPSGGARGKKC